MFSQINVRKKSVNHTYVIHILLSLQRQHQSQNTEHTEH